MKRIDLPRVTTGGEWGPSTVGEVLPGSAMRGPAAWRSGRSDSLSKALADSDRTPVFLHQLSQALTSLRGTLELALLVDADAQEYQRAIQQALAQAERLVQLFRAFRAASEADIAHEVVELGELVRMLLDQLHPLAETRRLVLLLGSGNKCLVRADPGRLLTALCWGLLCAVKQSPEGGKLEMSLSTKADNACLTLAATAQAATADGVPDCASSLENEPNTVAASDSVEGDWVLVSRAMEGLGGRVAVLSAGHAPLLCEIFLPLSQAEKD